MTGPTPPTLSYAKVVGNFFVAVDDSTDADDYPDLIPIDSGTVTFTPNLTRVQPAVAPYSVITLASETADIVNGQLMKNTKPFIYLLDLSTETGAVNPSIPSNQVAWSVAFTNLKAGNKSISIASFGINPTVNSDTDLGYVVPLLTGNAVAYTRGEVGPQGPQGIGNVVYRHGPPSTNDTYPVGTFVVDVDDNMHLYEITG